VESTNGDHSERLEMGPIRITIEIDRPKLGLGKARTHMRAAVREILVSLREVLDAGIEAVEKREESAAAPEKIKIE